MKVTKNINEQSFFLFLYVIVITIVIIIILILFYVLAVPCKREAGRSGKKIQI